MTVDNNDELGMMIAEVNADIEKIETDNSKVVDDPKEEVSDSEPKEDNTEVEAVELEKGSEEWIEQEVKQRAEKVIEKRIGKATWQRKTAEEKLAAKELEFNQLKESQKLIKPDLNKGDFPNDEEGYIKYAAKQEAIKLMQGQDKARADYNAKVVEQREINDKWATAINDYATVKPDVRQVLEGAKDIQLSTDVLGEILEGDSPAAIVYHIAKNPEKALKLSEMSEKARTRFLTKLEIKLESEPASVREPEDIENQVETVAPATKARPAPISVKNAKSGKKTAKDPILEFLAEWDEHEKKRTY